MSGVTFTEIDGVPVVMAPTDGPSHAGLVFRVGRADEPLGWAGITHLVEHLALHRHGVTDYHYNGVTAGAYTIFHAEGSEDDIVGYLHGVCDGLANLPYDRLETEKAILRAEAAGRTAGAGSHLAMWRHGAAGYGSVRYPEWGLPGLSADALRDWVDHWFTVGNAVLWIAGDRVPAGLRLPLRPGSRRELPPLTSALPERPAFFSDSGTGGVAFDAWVPRSAAADIYAAALDRALFRELRQSGGYSYTAAATAEAIHGDRTHVMALADAVPDQHGAVLGGFVDVLTRLRVAPIDEAELTALRNSKIEVLRRPYADSRQLPRFALDTLVGYPVTPAAARIEALAAVTADEVRVVARAAWEDGLLMAPCDADPRWAGLAPAPTESETVVPGIGYAPARTGDPVLQIGAEGVSWGRASVRFDDCAVVLAFPDGGRHLLGNDGIYVVVEPTHYQDPAAVSAALHAVVPPYLLSPQDVRDVPKRPAGAPPVEPPPLPPKPSGWYMSAIVGLSLMSAFMLLCTAAFLGTGGWALGAFTLVAAVGLGLPAARMSKRRRTLIAHRDAAVAARSTRPR